MTNITLERLQDALVTERAKRLKQYDDAYPEIGMGMGEWYYNKIAIEQLITEGLIPQDYQMQT